jgi:hypothetical protein
VSGAQGAVTDRPPAVPPVTCAQGEIALVGRQLSLALLMGFIALGLGANVVLLPALLPAGAFWIWPLCYWIGGVVALLGGLTIDLALIFIIARQVRARLIKCAGR